MARVTLVTSGLEHLGVSALSAFVRSSGHESTLVYEPKLFSSNSGPDNATLARWLEPTPAQTAERILSTEPDVVAFSSYTITHRWSVDVARAIKRLHAVPIVFGGPHVSGAPERAIRESSIDAVVEGEGEGALVDLIDCATGGTFSRTDVANAWFRGPDGPIRNAVRPLIDDLDTLPYADKNIFYDVIPAFEREFYVIARRGCPFRCNFCEYSIFPKQYPGEKAVRRRSVEHLVNELKGWKARGQIKKVFFWDAIFTLDVRWMTEFAAAYRRDVGLPFECYTHPHAMTRDMARLLADAGCSLVRVGVQTVNAGTLAALDRRGDRDRVKTTIGHLDAFDIAYSLDHMLGLPGEGPSDQRDAIAFYNEVRPARVIVHWMTYLPGTTALETAVEDGVLTQEQVDRVLDGEQTEGFEAPRLVGPGARREELDEIRKLSTLFDLMAVLPRAAIDLLMRSGLYRWIPRDTVLRQLVGALQSLRGDAATRARFQTILQATLASAVEALRGRRSASATRARPSGDWAQVGRTRESVRETPRGTRRSLPVLQSAA